MTTTAVLLLCISVALVAKADEKILTRSELFAPITDPVLNPDREYVELDLNGDGANDLVVSESVSLGGTGGLVYNLYLAAGQDHFRRLDQFVAGALAVEIHGDTKYLWSYSSGTIQYRYFDRKGRLQRSPVLDICTGDSGTETGNGIWQAIFREKTTLKTKTIGAPIQQSEGIRR
jgi:hypothetical protein